MLPKYALKRGVVWGVKSLEIKPLSQRIDSTNRLVWHTNSDFYGIRTPTIVPYESFLLGVGVVFNIIAQKSQRQGQNLNRSVSTFSTFAAPVPDKRQQ